VGADPVSGGGRARSRSVCDASAALRRRCHRDPEAEDRSLLVGAFELQVPTDRRRQLPTDVEAKSDAAVRPRRGLVGLEEALEDLLVEFGRDAEPWSCTETTTPSATRRPRRVTIVASGAYLNALVIRFEAICCTLPTSVCMKGIEPSKSKPIVWSRSEPGRSSTTPATRSCSEAGPPPGRRPQIL